MTARLLRAERGRTVIQTPHGGVLYVKHLPRRVKRAVKKGILRRRITPREYRRVDHYLHREGQRDQSHHFWVPKAGWGPGPWQDEPDYVDFVSAGLHCVIMRNMQVTGTLNGYVGVPPSHPWWGKEEDECLATPRCDGEEYDASAPFGRLLAGQMYYPCDHKVQSMVEVHGGVNWASPTIKSTKAAHRDLWWFAFDTSHAWDVSPMMEATLREVYKHQDPTGQQWAEHQRILHGDGETSYKDLAFVRHEIERLAEQIAVAAQVTR